MKTAFPKLVYLKLYKSDRRNHLINFFNTFHHIRRISVSIINQRFPFLTITEQLYEIRKTTLAGVICANEGLLDQAQPRVMEALSATNPLVDCKELPQPDFKPWKDPDQNQPTKKPSSKNNNKG